MDPADVALIMQPGDDLPPTVAALSVVLLAGLRDMVADGPVVLDIEDGPVVIELDGSVIIEHPLTPGSGGS